MSRSDTGPFALVPVWVLDSEVSALAIRVYAIHSDFADRHGTHYHSRKKIATRANCSLDALDRAHGELVKALALKIERRRHDGRGDPTSNRYWIQRVIPNLAAQQRLPSRVDAARGSRVDAALTRISNEPLQVAPLTAVEKAKGIEQIRRLRKGEKRDSA